MSIQDELKNQATSASPSMIVWGALSNSRFVSFEDQSQHQTTLP